MNEQQDQIQQIDPRLIKVPAVRIDAYYEPDQLAMLGEDIQKKGIEQPLNVALKDGQYWVVDGRHRLDEALRLGYPTIPCIVREMEIKEVQLRNLVTSVLKGKTKISEEIKMIGDLYNVHHVTIDEIVEKSGLKRDRIETEILISTANPGILEEIDAGRLSLCHAKELIRLPDHDQQYTMLQIILQYRSKCDITRELVTEALKQIEAGKNPHFRPDAAQPPPIPTATCTCCGLEYPLRQIVNPLLCRECFSTLIQAYQAGLRLAQQEQRDRQAATASAGKAVDLSEGLP